MTDGLKQEVVDKHHNQTTLRDPGPGRHLWTMLAVWSVADPTAAQDPTATIHLDRENLLTIEGPGCFKCEEPYTPRLAGRRCQGRMSLL